MTTTCLGIDVGLKTLALCITSREGILLWDTYNILEDENIFCIKCGKKAKYIHDTQHYCGIHSRKIPEKKIVKKVKYSLHELTKKIIKKIGQIIHDNIDIMNSVTSIIIELQPSVNQKMKYTSHVLFVLFTEFYIDKKCSIKFERASVKLKKFKSEEKVKNTYKNRKLRGIEYTYRCLENIKNSGDYTEFLENKKKRDDLCDAFLLSYNNLKI